MKRYVILLIALSFILTGCFTVIPGQTQSGDDKPGETTTETTQQTVQAGWVKEASKTYYILQDGSRHTGWLELNDTRYYLDSTGVLQTGWLELDGNTYYLKSDGSITRGKAKIDSSTFCFSSTGARVILVNPWNMVPSDYSPILKETEGGLSVEKVCKEPLEQMLADCRNAGNQVVIISAFREHSTQISLYNRKVNYYLDQGYDAVSARTEAGKVVAMPGTSEHELGLAVDLADSSYTQLDEAQENTAAQKWLMEHCWEYGFILRYPNEKSEKTGIIYEPWHYRYVGKELAKELHSSGLCLEEYLENLQ